MPLPDAVINTIYILALPFTILYVWTVRSAINEGWANMMGYNLCGSCGHLKGIQELICNCSCHDKGSDLN